jgi:hypothetical protein
MHKALYLTAALALSNLSVVMPLSSAQAQDLASPMIPPKVNPSDLPQDVKAAWGCMLMGTAGTMAALSANSVNLLNVVAGGIVTPANPAVLYLGLAGVVFTSFCTLGQQLTPLYVYYFNEEPAPQTDIAKKVQRVAGAASFPTLDDEDVMYPWQSAR